MVLLLSGMGVEFVLCVTSRLLVTDSHKAKAMPLSGSFGEMR
jgi:hypothetical protein